MCVVEMHWKIKMHAVCVFLCVCVGHVFEPVSSTLQTHPPIDGVFHAPLLAISDKAVERVHSNEKGGSQQASFISLMQNPQGSSSESNDNIHPVVENTSLSVSNKPEESHKGGHASASVSYHTGGGCGANCQSNSCLSGTIQCAESESPALEVVMEANPFHSPKWADDKKVTISRGLSTEDDSKQKPAEK